jgi:gluconate 2-dehydrogenase gamma chain
MSKNSNEDNKTNSEQSDTESADTSKRSFLKYAAAGAVGVGIASAVEIPVLNNMLTGKTISLQQAQTQLQDANKKIDQLNSQMQQDTSQINSLQSQVSSLQSQQAGSNAVKDLSISEQKLIEAIVETIIPSDSSGSGAKEAGVIYFIANQIGSNYGNNSEMYMNPPFVQSGTEGPITVDGITYSDGTPELPWQAAHKYQYNMTLRNFWRYGLEALQNYTNSVLGKNFEDLSGGDRIQMLNNLYDNKPTEFNGIVPRDFFQEVVFMTWSGFFMDPMYGGNQGMVGWKLTGFTGANMADSFGEGHVPTKLMVANKPTKLTPHSLGEFQKTLKIIGGS